MPRADAHDAERRSEVTDRMLCPRNVTGRTQLLLLKICHDTIWTGARSGHGWIAAPQLSAHAQKTRPTSATVSNVARVPLANERRQTPSAPRLAFAIGSPRGKS